MPSDFLLDVTLKDVAVRVPAAIVAIIAMGAAVRLFMRSSREERLNMFRRDGTQLTSASNAADEAFEGWNTAVRNFSQARKYSLVFVPPLSPAGLESFRDRLTAITPFAVDQRFTSTSIAFDFRADPSAREIIELFASTAGERSEWQLVENGVLIATGRGPGTPLAQQ